MNQNQSPDDDRSGRFPIDAAWQVVDPKRAVTARRMARTIIDTVGLPNKVFMGQPVARIGD